MIVKPTEDHDTSEPQPKTERGSNHVNGKVKSKRKSLTKLKTRSTIADLQAELDALKTSDTILNFCEDLFVKFALKRHPSTEVFNGKTIAVKIASKEDILHEVIHILIENNNIELEMRTVKLVVLTTYDRLKEYVEFQNQLDKRKCWMDLICLTCNHINAWPRIKLICSTMLSYIDIITDIISIVVMYNTVGVNDPVHSYWIFLSLSFIFLPSIFHTYYLSYCQGWRERSMKDKIVDFISNVCFLRPIIELYKSCRVSVDLENPEIDQNNNHVRIMMNVTNDFKSESFIMYKVFELTGETFPQIFLHLLVLSKLWLHWDVNKDGQLLSSESPGTICGDQSIFFFSLIVSCIQAGVTIEDLLERDVPYGVFPTVVTTAMNQENICLYILWFLFSTGYFIVQLTSRLLPWIGFVIFFGAYHGLFILYIVGTLIRVIIIIVVLGENKCGGLNNFDAHEENTLKKTMSSFDKNWKWNLSDEGSTSTTANPLIHDKNTEKNNSQESSTRNKNNKKELEKETPTVDVAAFNCFHAHALFVEIIPWAMLSVFVDMPLTMKCLRPYNDNENFYKRKKREARNDSRFFIFVTILSNAENIAMFLMAWLMSQSGEIICEEASGDAFAKKCVVLESYNNGTSNSINECYITFAPDTSKYPSEMYDYVNNSDVRNDLLVLSCILIILRIAMSIAMYFFIWGSRCKYIRGHINYETFHAASIVRRSSAAMFSRQQYGRSDTRSRSRADIVRLATHVSTDERIVRSTSVHRRM